MSGPLPGIVLSWQVDGLSLFFGLVIVSISAVTTLYAIGHARHQHGFLGSGVLYVLFVLAMLAVYVCVLVRCVVIAKPLL